MYFVETCAELGRQTRAVNLRNDVDKFLQRSRDFRGSELLMVITSNKGVNLGFQFLTTYQKSFQDRIGCDVTDLKQFSFIEKNRFSPFDC